MRLLLVWLAAAASAFAQLAVGARGGLPLTDFFHLADSPGATLRSDSGRFILGPTVELHFPAGFGLEFDALYRRYNYRASANLVDVFVNNRASNAWEFPLLVKYRVPGAIARPFLDAGVAWDRWSGVKQLTNVAGPMTSSDVSGTNTGVVLGAGLELHVPFVKISPEVRFTRWGASSISNLGATLRSNQNQAEFLIGLTF